MDTVSSFPMATLNSVKLAFLAFAALAAADDCLPGPTLRLKVGNCSFPLPGESVVSSWGVLLNVGGSSQVCSVPSTVVNSTLLMAKDVCDPAWLLDGTNRAQCVSRRGGFLTRSAFSDASSDIPSLNDSNPGWYPLMKHDNVPPFQFATRSALQLRDKSVTMLEGLITQGHQHSSSHLGLGETSSLLQSLKDTGVIGARSWGFDAGSQSYLQPQDGSLILGGYDDSAFDENLYTYKIAVPNMLNDRPCPLQVQVESMIITVNGTKSKDYSDEVIKQKHCIEP